MNKELDTVSKTKEETRILLVYPNLPLMLVPPLSIGIFTRILMEEGYQVDLFDTTHYLDDDTTSPRNRVKFLQARKFSEEDDLGVRIKTDLFGDFRRKVREFQPDIMLFSVVEDAFLKTIDMLETVSDLEVPHVLGGVFPTAAPQRCFDYPAVKMIALGEGETTIINVTEAVRLDKPLHDIPGIWYRGAEGTIYRNLQPPLVNINDYRPDFSLFSEDRFLRPMGGRIFKTIPVETFRGCPYSCSFCNSPMHRDFSKEHDLGNFLRRKTMANLRTELDELITLYDPEFFYFVDDVFLARPIQEIFDFCDMYEDIGLPFWFNTRSENCEPETMKRLKEVGCYRISFGIECGNEEFRQKVLLRKPTNEETIRRFEIIADSGIAFSLNLIIGMPGETRELIMDTVELVRSIRGYDTLTVSIFTPYHGTVLRKVAVMNGWLDDKTITKHTTSHSLLHMPPPYVSADDIDGLMRVVPFYCYFPKSEWENIRRAETDDRRGNEIFKRLSAIYSANFLKETQDDDKTFIVIGGTGCRSNPKDSFRVSPKRLSDEEILMLVM